MEEIVHKFIKKIKFKEHKRSTSLPVLCGEYKKCVLASDFSDEVTCKKCKNIKISKIQKIKPVKAWAVINKDVYMIDCPTLLIRRYQIFKTKKEAKADMLRVKYHKTCSIIPVLITPINPKRNATR